MEHYKLNAVIRTAKGRLVRQEKLIPAILYGRNIDTIHLAVPEAEMANFIKHGTANALIDLTLGTETHTVMLKELQRNRLRDEMLHVDFYSVDLTQKLTITVPIHLVGEAEGVKAGGVVQQQTREVEVRCMPTDIPQGFHLDISTMNIGDTKTVADIEISEEIELLTPEDEVVISVLMPRLEEEKEEEETETIESEETVEDPEQEAEMEEGGR